MRLPEYLLSLHAGLPRVVAVFCPDVETSRRAVRHVCAGGSGLPVWLFSTVQPPDDVARLCDRVVVARHSLAVLWRARILLACWVALSVTAWTGCRGQWTMKVAPFLFPPFRILVLNRHGDFFPGDLRGIARHTGARLRDLLTVSGQLVQAGFLTFLAFCAPLLRAVFRRLHGWEPLEVHAPAEGDGVDRFVPVGGRWDAGALERCARSSTARWILWQTSDNSIDPVLKDPGMFALTYQPFMRGWQKFLFPTAPFRQLQPGEVSRVLAPVSGTILVDRAKLLALGVPRCGDPGTAWRILFWQAAAAGWASYSVGGTRTLVDEPAQPGPETSFMLHTVRRTPLRRLGPRDLLLARGNIAFSPALRRGSDPKRLKVLVVSPFLPYPLSHGGAVRIHNLCRALADRVDFALIAVREKNEHVHYDHLGGIFREVYAVDLDTLPRRGGRDPRMVEHYRSESLRAAVSEVARQWRPDVLQVEFTQMAAYRECAAAVPAVLVEHDLTFSLYRQLARRSPEDRTAEEEYRRWHEFERRWLRDYDGVWTVSEADRDIAVAESARARGSTYNIPNGVDTERYQPEPEPADPPEILFVGSFRHLPNLIGFDAMAHEVMPRVWSRFPEARLRVVAGVNHEPFWRDFAGSEGRGPLDPRMEVHGFVEDLRPLYARASVVVAPLPVSAGTNIKVLEAMACGKAIVSTPAGCAGLDLRPRQEAIIASAWPAFADAVSDLLGDRELRTAMGERARRCAEARFSWTSIADLAYDSYLDLTGQPPSQRDIRKPDGQAAFSQHDGGRDAGIPGLRSSPAEAEYRPDLRG